MANEQCGNDFVLQRDTTGGGAWETIGGLRSKTFTMNNEAIDVTNHGSSQIRELLEGCGIFSMSVSGSGVYNADADTTQALEAAVKTGTFQDMRFLDEASRTYTGSFKVTSFERGSEYNAEATYSISLELSGDITIAG
jgi:TP901-1 family phage major tail protein